MGMNAINYNRLVTGTKMMDAGKGGVEASDFDGTDLTIGVGIMGIAVAMAGIVAGTILVTRHSGNGPEVKRDFDWELQTKGQYPFPAKTDPDSLPQQLRASFVYPGDIKGFHGERTNSTYWAMMDKFPGGTTEFDVYRQTPLGAVELQHMALNENTPGLIRFSDGATLVAEADFAYLGFGNTATYVKMAEIT